MAVCKNINTAKSIYTQKFKRSVVYATIYVTQTLNTYILIKQTVSIIRLEKAVKYVVSIEALNH